MSHLQALVLGLVQGLTEFIPISSTAHLRVVPHFLGWPDPGAAFSAVVQLGTLIAVFIYFAADVRRLAKAAVTGLWRRNLSDTPDSALGWSIAAGNLPIAVLGLGFKGFIEGEARDLHLIGASLIALALALMLAERRGRQRRSMTDLGFWDIQFIGLCQALALVPGCSRSGSTIMGGLFIGLERGAATRFSFLLGLPAIGASGLLKLFDLVSGGMGAEGLIGLAIGVGAAALSGYFSIGFLLRYVQRHRTDLFSLYRILLGGLIFLSLR